MDRRGALIVNAMENLGMKNVDLANRLECSVRSITEYRKGKIPRIDILNKLLIILRISYEEYMKDGEE